VIDLLRLTERCECRKEGREVWDKDASELVVSIPSNGKRM
jgi:hypothetical protein